MGSSCVWNSFKTAAQTEALCIDKVPKHSCLYVQVPIPAHLKFWGLDSGVRHSIGGADYASVRAGAFMGLRMMVQRKAERGPEPLGESLLSQSSVFLGLG